MRSILADDQGAVVQLPDLPSDQNERRKALIGSVQRNIVGQEVSMDLGDLASLREVVDEAKSLPPRVEVPFFQRVARDALGIPSVPVPEVYRSPIPTFDTPAPIREARQMGSDVVSGARAQAGLDAVPQGNIPAKAEALQRFSEKDRKPITDQGPLEILGRVKRGAIRELAEIPAMFGLLPAFVADQGMKTTRSIQRFAFSGVGIETTEVNIPNPETGKTARLLFFRPITDMSPEMKEELIRMGAYFGPEFKRESTLDLILNSEAERLGLVNPDEIPEGATSFGVPLTDRRFVPRQFAEMSADRPISRLLDVAIVGGLPAIAARGGASTALRAGQVARGAGAMGVERKLVQASLKMTEAAEAVQAPISRSARFLTREGLSLSPAGREFLVGWDARVWAKQAVKENSDLSFAARRMAEIELVRSMKKLTSEELKTLPLVVEGRLSILPGGMSPQMENALDVVKRRVRVSQEELMESGFLSAETADVRRWAPLVVTRTGKRIPPKEWDARRIAKSNAEIDELNSKKIGYGSSQEHERIPRFMSHDEVRREVAAVQEDWKAAASSLSELPDVVANAPLYFPRFPKPPTVRDILHEFFPTTGKRPGKLPIQKQFTGASILMHADIDDVLQQMTRYSAQVRRIVDSDKLIRSLKGASFTKPLKLDKSGMAVDLLPGHVPYNPEGFLQFYQRHIDFTAETARALESMGDFESALAQGIRNALGKDLLTSIHSVRRRTEMFQVPKEASAHINKAFRPTHPMVRVFWDRPTDAWRAGVLAFSPRWHLNNLIGGVILGSNAGIPPHRLLKPITRIEREALPPQLLTQSQVFVDTFKPHLGAAAETATGKIFQAVANSKPLTLGTRPLAWVRDKSYGVNQAVDNHFRSRAYLEVGRKIARNAMMKETGQSIINSREVLRRVSDMSKVADSQRKLMGALDRVFFNFNNMTPFERTYIRRIIPFWSWYREINRITLTLPFRSPVRAQGLRVLGELGKQADDQEVRKHLGIPKEYLPEYTKDLIFAGLDHDDQIVFYSPRGGNVFYGVGKWPIDTTAFHPGFRLLLEEMTGGRSFGRWGSYVPFKYKEAGEKYELDTGSGRLVEKRPGRGLGKRVARTLPLSNLVEDLVQYGTEGVISQRFDDTTPLSNILPALTGKRVTPTGTLDAELRPRRQRALGEVWGSFFGVGVSRYRLEEMIEQEAKSSKKDLNLIFKNKLTTDPEFRQLYLDVLGEKSGEPERALETIKGRQPIQRRQRGGR